MHHATSPTTGTPTTSPVNNSTPQDGGKRYRGIKKAVDISDAITLVDVAMERVRHHWRGKKAKKAGKETMPPQVAQLVTQALTVSRAHLMDYRELVTREQGGTHAIIQAAAVPAEDIMVGIHPFVTLEGERLKEPHEPIEKIKAVLSLLWASQDEDTQEFRVSIDQLTWATLLISDLVDEAQQRAVGYQNHCRALYLEVESRLKSYRLVPRDRKEAMDEESLQECRS